MQTIPLALKPPDAAIPIRPVRGFDVHALHRTCWPERPLPVVDQFITRAQYFRQQGRGLGVVVGDGGRDDEGTIIGYGQLTLWPRSGEISDLIITASQRGRGLGTALIQYLVAAGREMHVPAIEIGAALSNPGAVALYRRLGFDDSHTVMLNLGNGPEQVLILRLDFPENTI
jgi:ribosomal protein S18 acetylase RimI-like enzyme